MDMEFKHVPTLVIGLGGTGNEIARMLKTKFADRYPEQETMIRYLIIDTDRKSFRDGFWDREEQVLLRLSLMPRHVLASFYNNEHVDWLPQEPRISPDHFVNQEAGAGLIRPIGRLYLQDQVAEVRDRLDKAKNSLSDLLERKRTGTILGTGDFQVYVLSSLAGGTGSGAYLDLAALVRELFEENCFITGMFTLFSCYADVLRGDVDQARRSKANCYAALKELEFFMQEKDDSQPGLYTVKFWDGSRVNLYKRLFNTCYLVENTNDAGAQLSGLSQIYELCAQQLFHEIGSPLGEDYRSKINNLSFFQSGLGGVQWSDWGRKRRFSAFGNVSLVYPRQKVLDYCANKLMKEAVDQSLNGQTNKSVEQDLTTVFSLIGIMDNRLPLLDEVLRDMQEFLITYRLNESASPRLESTIARYQEEVERSLSDMTRMIEGKLKDKQQNWWQLLQQETGQRLRSGGAAEALQFIKQVQATVERSMHNCQRLGEQSRQDLQHRQHELADWRNKLRSAGFLSRLIGGKGLAENAADAYHIWLDGKVEREGYVRLGAALKELLDWLAAKGRELEKLQQRLGEVARQAEAAVQQVEFKEGSRQDGTVLVQEAVTREDCEVFYQQFAPRGWDEITGEIWHSKADDLESGLRQRCAAYFAEPLGKTSIVDFLRQKFSDRGNWNELLDELREICRPFWTARLKHGEYYNQTCLVGVAKEEKGFPPEIASWAKDRSDATRGIDCVNTYYPYAIDITVCTHGAFAGYISGIKEYQFQYEQFLRRKEFPLHLHEQFRYLSELDPYRDRVSQFFALAKAYGLIAEHVDGYFFALSRGLLGWEFRYKTQSQVKPANWEEFSKGVFPAVPSRSEPGFLGLSRESAKASLADNSTYVSLVDGFVRERIKTNGRGKVRQELLEYSQKLDEEAGRDPAGRQEVQALKLYIAGNLEKEKAYDKTGV